MNGIIYDNEIITPEKYKNKYYGTFTKKLNHRDCVKLSLFCAKYVSLNSKTNIICITLVEKWLKNEKTVTQEELYNTAYYSAIASDAVWTVISPSYYYGHASYAVACAYSINNANDLNLYLQTLLRTTKQYNTINHNNQHYESILKEIIKEDIDKLTDTDYNMLIDISQEYYNINPNITNKRILVELLRREYE